MTTLKFVMTEEIGFKLTERLLSIVDKRVGEGIYHSRGDYLRNLIRKDNSL